MSKTRLMLGSCSVIVLVALLSAPAAFASVYESGSFGRSSAYGCGSAYVTYEVDYNGPGDYSYSYSVSTWWASSCSAGAPCSLPSYWYDSDQSGSGDTSSPPQWTSISFSSDYWGYCPDGNLYATGDQIVVSVPTG